jgi:hypothetical protein
MVLNTERRRVLSNLDRRRSRSDGE